MERREGTGQGDELARIDHAIKFRRRKRDHRRTEPTATQKGDGHGKPRFARMYGRTTSQPASQLCSRPAPMGVIYMPYEAGIEDKAG